MNWVVLTLWIGATAPNGLLEDLAEVQGRVARMNFWVAAGVMEEWEGEHFFKSPWTLDADEEVMETRARAIDPDCPPVTITGCFPDRKIARNNYSLAYQWVRYLEQRIECNPWPHHHEDLQALLVDARWRLRVWDELDELQLKRWDQTGRRVRLQRLRTLIGRDRFERLDLPNCVPEAAINSPWSFTYPGADE